MSKYSPGPVAAKESLVRMVVNPMFVNKRKPELMPNYFGHAFSQGLSVQRLDKASVAEMVNLVHGFVEAKEDRAWLGYVRAPVEAIRALRWPDKPKDQAFCVYDTAEPDNSAHAEIGLAYVIEEADQVEFRKLLISAFGNGQIHNRQTLKEGAVWEAVSPEVRARAIPPHWQD
jgi:hypothetical protein